MPGIHPLCGGEGCGAACLPARLARLPLAAPGLLGRQEARASYLLAGEENQGFGRLVSITIDPPAAGSESCPSVPPFALRPSPSWVLGFWSQVRLT